MEQQMMKLAGRIGFLFLVVWLIEAATGQKRPCARRAGRNVRGGSNPYRGSYSNAGAASAAYQPSVTGGEASDLPGVPFGTMVL